jgi:hypothetical protein
VSLQVSIFMLRDGIVYLSRLSARAGNVGRFLHVDVVGGGLLSAKAVTLVRTRISPTQHTQISSDCY